MTVKERNKKYYKENKVELRAAAKKWRKNNPERNNILQDRMDRTVNSKFRRGRLRAKYAGLVWEITREEYKDLIAQSCAYCAGELAPKGVGLDRQNRFVGYTRENAVPCCKDCQHRKTGLEHAGFNYPRSVELLLEVLRGRP